MCGTDVSSEGMHAGGGWTANVRQALRHRNAYRTGHVIGRVPYPLEFGRRPAVAYDVPKPPPSLPSLLSHLNTHLPCPTQSNGLTTHSARKQELKSSSGPISSRASSHHTTSN